MAQEKIDWRKRTYYYIGKKRYKILHVRKNTPQIPMPQLNMPKVIEVNGKILVYNRKHDRRKVARRS